MDSARYYIALLLVVSSPGVFLFWFSVHPFIGFWRKLGPVLTLMIHLSLMGVLAFGVFLIRKPVLSIEFGTKPLLVILAAALFVFAFVLRIRISKQLKTRVLTGLPELAPEKYDNRLVTEGIYGRIRHPRYIQLALAFFAYALLGNYLAVYVVFAVSLLWVLMVARVEEKELLERFGDEYRRYCERVPRFVPKFRGGRAPQ